jgi:hypothetical protein
MATFGGIALIVIGVIFLGGALRAFPPGTMRGAYLKRSSWSEIIIAGGLGAGLIWGGLALMN